jgi:maleate isomerase
MTTADFTDLGVLPCDLDHGLAYRAAIGLIVLATDQTMEHEVRHLIHSPGVVVYHARLYNDADITQDSLRAMKDLIAPVAALILPGLHLDVVAFGCTSATMVLGEEEVFRQIRTARPGVACTTPVTAAFAAMHSLSAKRVGVLTPYTRDVNAHVRRYLLEHGMNVTAFATFDKGDDRDAARISPASIATAIAEMAHRADIDAVFVSCTSLRLAEHVAAIEAAVGVPVTSSDHALAWHCLRLAGVDDAVQGAGRLFQAPLRIAAPSPS